MIVKVNDVVKTYKNGVRALDHFSFQVRDGEIYGLLGPNGSGKTTCIHCILSLLNYESGSIEVFGETMKPTSYHIKQNIGLITQNVAVFDELTVYENIDYFCGLYIKDKVQRKALVEEAIEFVSLEDYRSFYPKKLSGGLLRRLHIACGIAHKPKLIILDEPTVAVDPQSRNKILEGIQELNRRGATIIYTSHYMEEVEQICDYILIMDKGKTVAEGTKDELKALIALGETIDIEIKEKNEALLKAILTLAGVQEAYYTNHNLIIKSDKTKSNIPGVLELLNQYHVDYERIHSESPTLNDVFLTLTGKELRD